MGGASTGWFTVAESLDVFDARRGVRALAEAHGFNRPSCDELAIVVSELATNILKHGVRGRVRFEYVEAEGGIQVTAEDAGPEIANLTFALCDGNTASGKIEPGELAGRPGIGAGLGAIQRLSDQLRYERLERGNRFVVTRLRARPRRSS